MAVIDELPGVEVSITTDGVALNEYANDEPDEPRTKTLYIESTSNQDFAVRLTVKRGTVCKSNTLGFDVYMDGTKVLSRYPDRNEYLHVGYKCRLEGIENVRKELIPFRFSEIKTVGDDHNPSRKATSVKHLGSIIIEVRQINFTWHNYPRTTTRQNQTQAKTAPGERRVNDHGIISEKALKGQSVSHRINVDCIEKHEAEAKRAPVQRHCTADYIGPTPAAKIIFQYRSMAALKSTLIVPREPSPPPLEERDPTTLSMADIVELQNIAKASQEKEVKVKIKREERDDNPRPRKAARSSGGASQLEIDNDGNVQECSMAPSRNKPIPEIIDLD